MREYVRKQTAVLLRRVTLQINRASRAGDADAVHDLRVAIRRLRRCLQVFYQFYPGLSWKKVRRRLAGLMDICGKVRDFDIAIELLGQAGVPPGSPAVRRLKTERVKAERELLAELRRWKISALSRRWASQLGL
jgi:CHAD domain-containing protein